MGREGGKRVPGRENSLFRAPVEEWVMASRWDLKAIVTGKKDDRDTGAREAEV